MEVNSRNIKLWSSIGPRAAFGLSALELVKKYSDLMVLTCDVSTSAGLDRFRKQYPDNYVDLGIAEQNMIGVAAGLASEKFKVITTSATKYFGEKILKLNNLSIVDLDHNELEFLQLKDLLDKDLIKPLYLS